MPAPISKKKFAGMSIVLRFSSSHSQLDRLAGAIILKVTYGYELKEGADPFVSMIEKVMDEFANVTTPGTYLVDVLPFRK